MVNDGIGVSPFWRRTTRRNVFDKKWDVSKTPIAFRNGVVLPRVAADDLPLLDQDILSRALVHQIRFMQLEELKLHQQWIRHDCTLREFSSLNRQCD